MKKSILKNKQNTENAECPNEIFANKKAYPPLFCVHTWTKSVPICVIY